MDGGRGECGGRVASGEWREPRRVDQTDGADLAVIRAPSAFSGDLSRFNGGLLAWDGNTLQAGGPDYSAYGTVTISSTNGSASADVVPGRPPTGIWVRYACEMTPAMFNVSPAQWAQILQSVTNITLNVEGIFGAEIQGIDNVTLAICRVDFDGDGFVTGVDFDAFVRAFELGEMTADFNGDGFINGPDFDQYVVEFESGC